KTIFLYTVVLSLMASHGPETLELVIIDPKQTDFTVFQELLHLRDSQVIIDAERGVDALRTIADQDMSQRSDKLQKARCRDIKTHNLAHPTKLIRPLVIV